LRPSAITSAQHVGIERAAQAALAAHHQQQHVLFGAFGQQRVSRFRNAQRRRADHRVESARIGAGGDGALLCATQPRRRDELHRAGDLLRVPHRANASLEI
jgi:hypothetical protein